MPVTGIRLAKHHELFRSQSIEITMKLAIRAILAAALLSLGFGAGAADKMSNDKKDVKPAAGFVMEAGQDGHAEVELGKLAQKNASSGAVKEFGQRMVSDHSKAGAELGAMAKKLGLTPPSGPSDKQ